MDEVTIKQLFDWAKSHEKRIMNLDASISCITQSVDKMFEIANARVEECQSFDCFITNSLHAVTSAIMKKKNETYTPSRCLGRSDCVGKIGEHVPTNLDVGSEREGGNKYVYENDEYWTVNQEHIDLIGVQTVQAEGIRSNLFGEGGQSFEKEENVLTCNLNGEDEGNGKKETIHGCCSSREKRFTGKLEFAEVASNFSRDEDGTIMTDGNRTGLGNVEIDFIYVSDEEEAADDENDKKSDDFIVDEFEGMKTASSCKDRMLAKAWDSVAFDQEDEILMEGKDVNRDSYDVLNDMSDYERENLGKEDVPSEILRLVYGHDVYNTAAGKSPYPISCESPCKVETKYEEQNHSKNNLIDTFKLRNCNKSFPDNAMMLYIMRSNLEAREMIVATDSVIVRRSHMLSLQPERLLDSRIINAMVDILSREQAIRSPGELKFWWIPTTVSRPKHFRYDVMSARSEWDPWVGHLSQCEKIYLPICAKRHWFLAIVDLKVEEVFVYDDLTVSSIPLGTAIVDTILKALDKAFIDEIRVLKGCHWSFSSFPVLPPLGMKFGCKGFDCGINVIKRMQAAHNGDKICFHGSKDEERLCVAMQLIMWVSNKVRWSVMDRAISCEDASVTE